MKVSKNGLDIIKHFEGLSLKPYADVAGIPTIGYGNTYYPNGDRVTLKDKSITREQADEMLQFVLVNYENAVNRYVQVQITQNQFDALVSFAYNVGNENLRKSTLLKLINQQQFDAASKQFKRWNRAGGRVIRGLVRRRQLEEQLFTTA